VGKLCRPIKVYLERARQLDVFKSSILRASRTLRNSGANFYTWQREFFETHCRLTGHFGHSTEFERNAGTSENGETSSRDVA
jgi:hypothetical protein